MTPEDLDQIEEDWRGTLIQRADVCRACRIGLPLLRSEEEPYGVLHVHLRPWDAPNPGHEDDDEPDPRPDIRRLIDALRAVIGQ